MDNPHTPALDWQTHEHPIDPQIRAEIEKTLARIEAEHQVRVLFACESGSRGWGFASPDSDYDVRFIYVHRPDWYLTVLPGRDVIELPVNDIYDVSGWDLRKTLGLLRNGNATVVEWLSSPVVYRADVSFSDQIRAAADLVHRPDRVFHHHLQMARKNFREYLRGERVRLKKYLYVLRPLMAAQWVEQQRGPVPMRFLDLVDGLVTDAALRAAIDKLLVIKRRAGEAEEAPAIPEINRFIQAQLQRLEQVPTPQKDERGDYRVLDRLLRDTVLQGQ